MEDDWANRSGAHPGIVGISIQRLCPARQSCQGDDTNEAG